ncbi:MAG TPA: hypothetical protein VHE81_17440, partial [Lacipirellulaceae bacterium]|nr:hypothetical protein [Lacipirellulaceae bacterium]
LCRTHGLGSSASRRTSAKGKLACPRIMAVPAAGLPREAGLSRSPGTRMPNKSKRARKGGLSRPATKKHLTPGLENQLGAAKSRAEDVALTTKPVEPGEIRWLGTPGREREEFRLLQQRPLEEQVRMAVVGDEKFRGMGPGLVFALRGYQTLDGDQCFKRLEQLEQAYSGYNRWAAKEQRWKWVRWEEPIEYRTLSLPRYRSVAFQRALYEGVIRPEEFRHFLCATSRVLKREFRRATKYKGAERGLEPELVLWHLQQGVIHAHLIVRKSDKDGNRLGLVGGNGKIVWNELEMALVAERRRRAAEFRPIPKIMGTGEIIEDWRMLDRWTRSRMEGDDKSGKSKRARDKGLLETWDMQVNDVLDSLVEGFALKRPALWRLMQEEEERAKEENRQEYADIRARLGLDRRDALTKQVKTADAAMTKLTEELGASKKSVERLQRRIAQLEKEGDDTKQALVTQIQDLQQQLDRSSHVLAETEKQLQELKAGPIAAFSDPRSKIVAMSDALKRVLCGVQPSVVDCLFLQPSTNHLGSYQIAPAFIAEAAAAALSPAFEKERKTLMMLDRASGFSAFEAVTVAITKLRDKRPLTETERGYFTRDGYLKDSIRVAAHSAMSLGQCADAERQTRRDLLADAASEMLDTARGTGRLRDKPSSSRQLTAADELNPPQSPDRDGDNPAA